MYLLFDIGGTRTRVAISRDLAAFDDPVVFETPGGADAGVEKLIEEFEAIIGEERVRGIAGALPGQLNREKTELVAAGNLTGWVKKPVAVKLGEHFDAPVYLENDASLVGLGEVHFGAGQGEDDVVYITVSTGVGGGRIVDGRIDPHSSGFEPGRQIIDADQSLCAECRSGRLEHMVSGTATRQRFGKPAEELPQEHPCWEELAKWFAVGLHNTAAHWSPRLIILGGAMIVGSPAVPFARITEELTAIPERIGSTFTVPDMKKAQLGSVGGLYGAMALLKQKTT